MNFFSKVPKVSIKTLNLRPFEVFFRKFLGLPTLCFLDMSEVVYEKNSVCTFAF